MKNKDLCSTLIAYRERIEQTREGLLDLTAAGEFLVYEEPGIRDATSELAAAVASVCRAIGYVTHRDRERDK
jgi:hypothetical protein